MIREISVPIERECIALLANLTYKNEKAWYGETERPLSMSLFVPKHKENHHVGFPLLVWLCGGALSVVDQNIWMPQLLSFAEKGFIVASIEYRTSNDQPLPAALLDVKSAIRYLRSHADRYCIDPENVFIAGESAGGMLASLTGVTNGITEFDQGDYLDQSSAVNAVIDIYGVSNLRKACEDAGETSISLVTRLQEVGLTPSDTDWSLLDRFSAINYVNEKTVPFLILHGTEDEKVPISQSEILYEKLTEYDVECDFYRLQGCMHGVDHFYQPSVIKIIYEFMIKHLKG